MHSMASTLWLAVHFFGIMSAPARRMRAVYIQTGKGGAAVVHAGLLEVQVIGDPAGGAAAIPANLQHRRAMSRRDGPGSIRRWLFRRASADCLPFRS